MTVTADDLRGRTKKFAIRIVKLFRALPSKPEARVIGHHYCVRVRPSRRTIVLPAGRGRGLILLLKLGLWLKRLMRVSFGWKCW